MGPRVRTIIMDTRPLVALVFDNGITIMVDEVDARRLTREIQRELNSIAEMKRHTQ